MIASLMRVCWLTWLTAQTRLMSRFRQGFTDAHTTPPLPSGHGSARSDLLPALRPLCETISEPPSTPATSVPHLAGWTPACPRSPARSSAPKESPPCLRSASPLSRAPSSATVPRAARGARGGFPPSSTGTVWTPGTSPCPATTEPGALRNEPPQRDRPLARLRRPRACWGRAGPLSLTAWCWLAPRGCGVHEACAGACRSQPATAAGPAGQAPGRSPQPCRRRSPRQRSRR